MSSPSPSPSSPLLSPLLLHNHHQQKHPVDLGGCNHNLYGRSKESKLLLEAFFRCSSNHNHYRSSSRFGSGSNSSNSSGSSPECVLITGASGMGKTSLVLDVLRPRVLSEHGLFLWGKFESSPHYQPYEVIVSAFAQLADQLLSSSSLVPGGDDRLYDIQQAVSLALGEDEVRLLTDLIPGLDSVIVDQDNNSNHHHSMYRRGSCGRRPSASSIMHSIVSDDNDDVETESLSRFQFVFSEFCRAVSSVTPLVIFLDDMQWCDQASLELIQALLRPKMATSTTATSSTTTTTHTTSDSSFASSSSSSSMQRSSLLLVTASRVDELHLGVDNAVMDEKSDDGLHHYPHSQQQLFTFNPFAQQGAKSSSSYRSNITRIHLSSLSEAETKDFIVQSFELEHDVAQSVASRAYKKCAGNILHTLQYMRTMGLATGSSTTTLETQYRHNEEKVMDNVEQEQQEQEDEEELDADSVENLILQHVHKLPLVAQQLLQMAGCIGNVINEVAMSTVTDKSTSEVTSALDLAVQQELLEFVPKRCHFRFVHDSVRQAVLSMIDDQEEMSFRIGYKLWKQSSTTYKDTNLFTIVNLLNKGVTLLKDPNERYQVAELNLSAGRRAASKVSFRDASRYYNTGIEFLQMENTHASSSNYWTEQYDLALRLHDSAASTELSNQNFHRVDELVTAVLQHARSFKDKLNAYANQIVATGQQGKVTEATKTGLDVLRQLGEKVPNQEEIADLRADLAETERALHGRSNADILSLPYMDDEDKEALMRFLLLLIPYALEAGSLYSNWIAMKVVRLTLSHGLSKGCAHGFASYARYICRSNARLGYNYGQLAALIVEKCCNKELMPRVYISIYSMTSPWTRPLRESLDPLQSALEVAIENGDVEYAHLAAFFRSTFSLNVGVNLVQVEQVLKEAKRQMSFYKQNLLLNLTSITLQFVRNLLGKNKDPKILSADVYHPNEGKKATTTASSSSVCNPASRYIHLSYSMTLAYLFGDLDLANEHSQALFALNTRGEFTTYSSALSVFYMGLVAVAQVRRGIQPEQNLERGQHCVMKMVGWARDCPHNFLNKKALLDAEMQSLQAKNDSSSSAGVDAHVLSLYNQSIEGALEEGFLDEAAMASERAGDYLHRHQNTVEAERYWNKAQRLFHRWGATAKSEAIKNQLATCVSCHQTTESHLVECAS